MNPGPNEESAQADGRNRGFWGAGRFGDTGPVLCRPSAALRKKRGFEVELIYRRIYSTRHM